MSTFLGSWWYGIGASPTEQEIRFAADHYDVVVLNAWETAALRELRRLNPKVTALVYKDMSSTRNYPGTVDGGVDARRLPTGLGYQAVQREHPVWFALDNQGRRIEWRGYPKHWQMAVWSPGYQRAWAAAVTAEVVAEGWDGVLADNDFYTLRWYSNAVLAVTADRAGTDHLLRKGLRGMLGIAGPELRKHGKVLVPNISESHLAARRWSDHSSFGGGMDENFVLRTDDGLLTFQGTVWEEMRAGAAAGDSWQLLMSHAAGDREQRVGFAAAALLAGPRTCWAMSSTQDYRGPDWSQYQDLRLGDAQGVAVRESSGVWTRRFSRGWVAVNPTDAAVRVPVPSGMVGVDGRAVRGPVSLSASDGLVLTVR